MWELVIKDINDKKLANEEIEEILRKHNLTERDLLLMIWNKVKE